MLKSFRILIFFFAFSFGVFAQSTSSSVKISGLLTDENNKPLDYASVSLLRISDSSVVKGALTNETGLYTFENIKPGKYVVKATSVGYINTVSEPFFVAADASAIHIPVLKMHESSQSLKTITITASKPLIEHKADRTVVNVANSILATGNSAMEILERAPGVSIDKDDNISLKGKQGVTVTINDKLTYLSADQLAALLRSTDGSTIQSIELITNPSAKYDAAGNSGIINIKLKQNKQSGTNGSFTTGAGIGKNFRDNSSISLNHKEGDLNVFGSFSHDDLHPESNITLDRIINNNDNSGQTYFDQQARRQSTNHNNAYRIGADYETSPSNTIGFSASGYGNSSHGGTDNNTQIQSTRGTNDSLVNTNSVVHSTFKNLAVNLNDKLKLDTSGQELSADLDYSKYKNDAFTQYNDNFLFPDGSLQRPQQIRTNGTPSTVDIHTIKVDYTKSIDKTLKLEAGAKYSNVKTDNNLQAQVLNNGTFMNDSTQSNHFIYTEKITAGYVNLNKQFNGTSVQLGLRSEYTQSNGDLIGRNSINRNYLDFFPNVFINHTLDSKNELNLSYSRRIDRPGYDDLNPFTYFLDPFTFIQGNAFLNPQYTNKYEADYVYNKAVNVSLGYSHISNVISNVILTNGNKSISTERNLNANNVYNIDFNSPYTITKWWSGDVDFNSIYQQYKADTLAGSRVKTSKLAFQVKATETFTLDEFKGELMGDYSSASVEGITNIKPYYGVDAGLSRSFDHKKLNMKLAVSDIFKTRSYTASSQILSNFNYIQKYDSRITRLTVTYYFGNNKTQTEHHTGGAEDEAGRVKTN